MSLIATRWAFSSAEVLNNGLTSSDLAVLRALCWFFNDKTATRFSRSCYPSVETLMKATGLRKSAVDGAKKRLAQKGLILWDRAMNLPGETHNTNSYHINCPALLKRLRKNEERTSGGSAANDGDEEEHRPHAMTPGLMYYPPDREALRKSLPPDFDEVQLELMYDALEFVLDTPEHRKLLIPIIADRSRLAEIREAINRVRSTSAHGRMINNRMGYLLSAIRGTEKKCP